MVKRFGGIDWDRRHPETLDIEPGSCDWWMQMDKCFGTSPDSPLHHENRHKNSLVPCKPMNRIPEESIEKIEVWTGIRSNKQHTTVFFWDEENDLSHKCSCGEGAT